MFRNYVPFGLWLKRAAFLPALLLFALVAFAQTVPNQAASATSTATAIALGTSAVTVVPATSLGAMDVTFAHPYVAVATVNIANGATAEAVTCGGSNGWPSATVTGAASVDTQLTLVAGGTLAAGASAPPVGILQCTAAATGPSVVASGGAVVVQYGNSQTIR